MRFKGFFKEYWSLVFKPSMTWLKKYWFAYIIFSVVICISWMCYTCFRYLSLDDLKKIWFTKPTDDEELEEFLK